MVEKFLIANKRNTALSRHDDFPSRELKVQKYFPFVLCILMRHNTIYSSIENEGLLIEADIDVEP